MSALATERNTPARDGKTLSLPVKGSTKIFQGSLVAINASSLAVPGATATTLRGVGRAEETVDNSAGADSDLQVRVARGVFRFGNSASTDQIALKDIGAVCYIVDDQTVAKTDGSSTRSIAGTVRDVDSAGVWVEF